MGGRQGEGLVARSTTNVGGTPPWLGLAPSAHGLLRWGPGQSWWPHNLCWQWPAPVTPACLKAVKGTCNYTSSSGEGGLMVGRGQLRWLAEPDAAQSLLSWGPCRRDTCENVLPQAACVSLQP